ncbi:Yip1 family protein [Kitasatospora sp. NPDC059673]|uniref:Yip1 family protein n=1 Tax=Kitasatospora sp. NPDC059673 TaxID=3346901 RepID=UPI0036A33A3A
MAGNRHDDGRGADPRRWTAPQPGTPQSDPYRGAPTGGPEYFTAPTPGYPAPNPGYPAPPAHPGDQPGHTRAFAIGEQPYDDGAHQGAYGAPYDPYGGANAGADGYYQQQYDQQYAQQGGYPVEDNVAVYRAGGQAAPHLGGPRLPWRELLAGIYRRPSATFDRMRDHQVWLPALSVSLLYGVLAVFALDSTYDEVVHSTFAVALWAIAAAAVGFTVAGGILSAVTYALARQFGGDGPWQSTIGLAVLVSWTTDVPRLLLALFLPADNLVVQAVGWATWVGCAALLTILVRRIHDLPWGKAAGAAAVQLIALLVLIKLPTLG